MTLVHLRPFTAKDAPWLTRQHGQHYTQVEGFDDSFEPLVASILDDFIANHDSRYERGWIMARGDQPLGSIFCVRQSTQTAKLRLFFLCPEARGLGLGKQMLNTCVTFAKKAGYREIVLWTHESHRAACALYAMFGWQLMDSKPVHSFGRDMIEQSWKITL